MSYELSALSIVGSIRTSLHGVTGFSIVKELIQNADDSGAKVWTLGLTEGIAAARHPLLRSRALFVINDGSFRANDAKALRQLHLSGKAEDRGSIGKFGLGLKSIFQLGEAFFFFAPENSRETFSERYPGTNVISPWIAHPTEQAPDTREDWYWEQEAKEHDTPLVRQALRAKTRTQGFTLWIPLRTREQCQPDEDAHRDGELPSIQGTFFNERNPYPKDLLNRQLAERLARVWPMLSSLERMEVLGPTTELNFTLNLEDGSVTRRYPQREDNGTGNGLPVHPQHLEGRISAHSVHWAFTGRESGVLPLQDLRSHPQWPKSLVVGLARNEQVKDKSVPHAAAVFQGRDLEAECGELRITWSVFLPVGDKPKEKIALEGSGLDVDLIIHGFFFLDPARANILPWDDTSLETEELESEAQVQQHWNARLAQEGSLPNVLPALARFTKPLAVQDTVRLTSALQASKFFQKHRQYICADHSWVSRLDPEGATYWSLEAAHTPVLALPELQFATELFPALTHLAVEHVIVDTHADHLTAKTPLTSWPAAITRRLLQDAAFDRLVTPHRLDVLTRFLELQSESRESGELDEALVKLAQGFFQMTSRDFLDQQREVVRRFIQFIPVARRWSIPEGTNPEAVKRLLHTATTSVAVPPGAGVSGIDDDSATLDGGEALRLLGCIANTPNTQGVLRRILSRSKNRLAVLEQVKAKPLFELRALREPDVPAFSSLATLRLRNAEGTLFQKASGVPTSPNAVRDHADALQSVLRDIDLFQISGQLASVTDLEVKECNRVACIDLLGTKPSLVDAADERLSLFRSLQMQFQGERETQALRYLIHKSESHYAESALLFYPSSVQPPWSSVMRKLLYATGEGWRWIEDFPDLDQKISGTPLKTHAISAPIRDTCIQFLGEHATNISLNSLTPEEHDLLLAEIPDTELLRALPIHLTTGDARVRLDAGAYLESDFLSRWTGTTELFDDVVIVKRSYCRKLCMGVRRKAAYHR